MPGALLCVDPTSTIISNLTSLSDEWCVGRWANFSCFAKGISTTTSLTWTASSYIRDRFSLSTSHDIGTKRPKYPQLHESYAILTNKSETSIESQLHLFVNEDTNTTGTVHVFCVVDPPGAIHNISRSEGTCMYVCMQSGPIARN